MAACLALRFSLIGGLNGLCRARQRFCSCQVAIILGLMRLDFSDGSSSASTKRAILSSDSINSWSLRHFDSRPTRRMPRRRRSPRNAQRQSSWNRLRARCRRASWECFKLIDAALPPHAAASARVSAPAAPAPGVTESLQMSSVSLLMGRSANEVDLAFARSLPLSGCPSDVPNAVNVLQKPVL